MPAKAALELANTLANTRYFEVLEFASQENYNGKGEEEASFGATSAIIGCAMATGTAAAIVPAIIGGLAVTSGRTGTGRRM